MANGVLFTQKRSVNTIRYSVIILLALAFTFPLLYLVSGSLMTLNEVTVYPPKLLPTTINLQNYAVSSVGYSIKALVDQGRVRYTGSTGYRKYFIVEAKP